MQNTAYMINCTCMMIEYILKTIHYLISRMSLREFLVSVAFKINVRITLKMLHTPIRNDVNLYQSRYPLIMQTTLPTNGTGGNKTRQSIYEHFPPALYMFWLHLSCLYEANFYLVCGFVTQTGRLFLIKISLKNDIFASTYTYLMSRNSQ